MRDKVRAVKTHFFTTTLPAFMRHEPHNFWRYLSSEKTSVPEIKSPNAVAADSVTLAEKFNSFFQSVLTDTSSQAALEPYIVNNPIYA